MKAIMLFQSERDISPWQHLSVENSQEVIRVLTLIEMFACIQLPKNKTVSQLAFLSNRIILDFAMEVLEEKQLWITMPDVVTNGDGEFVEKNELRKELETIIDLCR